MAPGGPEALPTLRTEWLVDADRRGKLVPTSASSYSFGKVISVGDSNLNVHRT